MEVEADDLQFIRCAIYTRQSVLRRGDPALASCKVQRLLCTEFIRSMAWRGWYPIGERFDDEGFSGATVERPGLEQLFQRIREGDVQRVIVYRLDRLTRRLSDWALLVGILQRFNVGLTIVHGAIDAEAGSLARLQRNMLATFAELELDLIAERLADARAARKARGERSAGRVPLGYTTNPRSKQLVIAETEAKTVRWFFEKAAAGKAPAELATSANKLGLPTKTRTPGAWSPRAVLRLLQNKAYTGRRPDGSPGSHPAIITATQFERAQKAIAGRRSRARVVNASPCALRAARSRSCTPSILHRFAALRPAFSPRPLSGAHTSTPRDAQARARQSSITPAASSSQSSSAGGSMPSQSLGGARASGSGSGSTPTAQSGIGSPVMS